MKRSFLINLAIATSCLFVIAACVPSGPTTSTAPSPISPTVASSTATPPATPTSTPSASPDMKVTAVPKAEKAPDTVRIAVINNSGKVLKAIYMSAPQKKDWGENELDLPLQDREKADFEWKRSSYKGDDAGCVFDIKAEYADGKIAELDPIDVCKTPAINLK